MQNVSQFGKLDVRATYVSVQASGYVSSASHISHQNDLHNDNNNKPAPTAAAATTRLSKLPYISPHASLLPPILPNTVIKFQSVRSEQKRRTTKPTPSGSLPLPLPSTPLPPPPIYPFTTFTPNTTESSEPAPSALHQARLYFAILQPHFLSFKYNKLPEGEKTIHKLHDLSLAEGKYRNT